MEEGHKWQSWGHRNCRRSWWSYYSKTKWLCHCPFTHGCGQCDACRASFDGSCDNHLGNNWSGGVQAEYIRFPLASWALVKIPGQLIVKACSSHFWHCDLPTGYHAARVANVQKGDKMVVIGDGLLVNVLSSQLRCVVLLNCPYESSWRSSKNGFGVRCDCSCCWTWRKRHCQSPLKSSGRSRCSSQMCQYRSSLLE